MTLPVALTGTDVIGQAKTGTGKTLGFGLPLLERVTVPADVEAGRAKPEQLTEAPQALVVVPTRELCQQVTNDLLTAGKVRNVRVLAIYGGRAYEPQVEALKKGVDVIVGTPGRLLDLAGQKKLDLSHVRALVLDEADEMLDLGFLPDVEKIMNMLPARRQTMLFSATMPGAVIGLARRYMSQPTHIRAAAPDDEGKTVANTAQYVYRAHNMDKPELVARILQADGRGLAMVFCRTKRTAADLADQLAQRGFASGAVHGDLGQGAREQALRAFRNGKVDVLVCTDVAARGIDVEGVTHVINYQSPEEEKTYLHRIGRTGRAGAKGIAITLVDWDDIPRWQLINKALELNFNDPPETYSTSPHLFEELSIPAGTKGVLPRSERTRAGLGAEELEDLGETGGRGGPRGRGGRGGHSSGPAAASAPPAERERPARTPRSRRRTRGGAASDAPTTPTASAAPVTSAGDALAPSEQPTERRTPRRRRRTRGAAAESVPAPTTTFVEPSAEAAVATAEGTAPATEQPRRRRTRRTAESAPTTPVEVNPVATPVVPEAETPEEQPRRRRTRKAAEPVVGAPEVEVVAETKARRAPRKTVAATATAEAAVDTAEGVEAKPRRTATRKATAPAAEAAVDTAETVEAKPRRRTARKAAEPVAAVVEATPVTPEPEATKPRRTRKAVAATAPAAEAALDTAEAVEAKPRRGATRKAAEPAVVAETVDIPAQPTSAETPEPKRRTTRKATAPAAEAAVDTAEGVEAKPRRRTARKTAEAPAVTEPELTEPKPRRTARKATATAAQAAVDTAEATEAKPRRTTARKATATAPAAEAAVDTAEGVEAKPRRRAARKAVEVVADIPAQVADDAEAKPRRRARKAAEPVVVVETAPVAAEAKPRRRATRKATVSAPTTDAVEA
ncbi:DEAD/DEAH box helicase [Streptomyces sp. AK08-02]|uniref:DEAD/DEAH box helicase n=1 Tax=Streptomyces sp. AK08-02 TaxID=3028654 RepID=UPI0029BC3420|nr:DEAD/DEAH box helicase [Streptomyces sp. AK08-02]MDX3750301.1 DEAD/DEAH box helicase [Streptomyces sp. AK08-02]